MDCLFSVQAFPQPAILLGQQESSANETTYYIDIMNWITDSH